MKDEFFVTLFSNSNTEIYPKNSKSKFTCKLPVSLDFHSNQNYSVGLVDCVFPRILGTIANAGEEFDVVRFAPVIKVLVGENRLERLVNVVLQNAKKPSIYHKNYFRDFLNLENLKSFENNPQIARHKVTREGGKKQYAFKIYGFKDSAFRTDERYFACIFEQERNYTLNQIMWIICNTYNQILKAAREDDTLYDKYGINRDSSDEEILYNAVFTFINQMLTQVVINHNSVFEDSDYLLIYTNIIEERIIGDGLSKVLYLTNRGKNTVIEQLDVKNIQYIPVIKQNIDEISVFIADEQGQQFVFESDKTPTCLTLHFKKNV